MVQSGFLIFLRDLYPLLELSESCHVTVAVSVRSDFKILVICESVTSSLKYI